ncbi:MAG: DUF1538 domain-containing protein [Sulfurimonas sp.]|uniref:DUF1538 domain-containing protein n=1 Tax=Sulfurimonas sp. TaxID=2022749 RepID=UPI0025DEF002|nr:DUF1538 domain-containing protein [Sulfurimonas sp.]MCK9490607.1 DUF1538 domain-containing protein [Sulfurimonas sp.]
MNEIFKQLRATLLESVYNILPILIIITGFQFLVFQTMPDEIFSIAFGFLIVIVGVAFFLVGLELGVFPLGNSLSNEFLEKKSVLLFTLFGFFIGFSASIAEPAIIAVAMQAQGITRGAIDAFTLRLIIATSVGAITAFGVIRALYGWSVSKIIIGGYILVLAITAMTPPQIIGLAYDSGGVATNVATVPLIVAIGIGIASSLSGRSVLKDGFGFVALAAITPMVSIQLYGIFALGDNFNIADIAIDANIEKVKTIADYTFMTILGGIVDTFTNIVPILLSIFVFQYLVLRKRIPNLGRVIIGFIFLVFGLYGFIVGIKLGLFPIGESIASSLVEMNSHFYIYLFAFLIGFGTTMAEPALVAVIKQADRYSELSLNVTLIRILVALGVGCGILLGTYKIVEGLNIWILITSLYGFVVFLTFFAPKEMHAFAFDLGGVTTSEITVPLVTAFGIYLATNIPGRDILMDGFGLIAFASVFPMITVLSYSIAAKRFAP